MKLATWNVNSIRTRKNLVIDFLHSADIDVLAMQETKCKDEQFPFEDFTKAGYEVAHFGVNQWNGVAIASRLPLSDIDKGFQGMPGFSKNSDEDSVVEARAISATIEGIRVCSVYVPNGRAVGDPHFDYKLSWLSALGVAWADYAARPDSLPFAIMGDFNIAPLDSDVGDPEFLVPGTTHTSEIERETLQRFLNQSGVQDVIRERSPEGFTFWDYKQGKFQKNQGLRIDFIFGSDDFAELVVDGSIEAHQRRLESPSDHVPVVVDIQSDDEDDRPMVF